MGTAGQEARHEPTGERGWSEVFELEFWNPDGHIGGFVRFELRPAEGVCWFWTSLLRESRPLVTVLEFDSALPRWPGIELRGPALWAELIVETPWTHVSLGLEAFAVELADPADVFAGCRGDLVPLGYDLEWETEPGSYPLVGVAHGEILLGTETIDFDGVGRRNHFVGDGRALREPSGVLQVAPVETPDGSRRGWVLDLEGPYWVDLSG